MGSKKVKRMLFAFRPMLRIGHIGREVDSSFSWLLRSWDSGTHKLKAWSQAYDEGADFTTRKIPLDRALMTGGYTPRGDPQRRNPSKRYFPRGSPSYLSERPRKQTRLFSGNSGRTEIGFGSLGSFFFRKAPQLQTYLSGGGGVVAKAGVMTPLRRTSRLISRKGFRRDYVTSRPRLPFLLGNSIPKWIIHSIRHVVSTEKRTASASTSKRLMEGQYKFGKPNRPKLMDKSVQKALESVLHEVYEPRFHSESHRFRPGRSRHTALKDIKRTWKGIKWGIEAHMLPSFQPRILLDLLDQRMDCRKTRGLVKSLLKTGWVQIHGLANFATHSEVNSEVFDLDNLCLRRNKKKTLWTFSKRKANRKKKPFPKTKNSQKSLKNSQIRMVSLNGLFCNIYFHELDRFMKKLQTEENLGRSKRLNPRYVKIRDAMSRARSQGEFEKRQKLRTLLHRTPSKHAQDPNYRRVVYRRYRDQFVVGVIGPKSFAVKIQNSIHRFLQTHLQVSLDETRTKLVHFEKSRLHFVGREIHANPQTSYLATRKMKKTGQQVKMRMIPRPFLKAPLLYLYQTLHYHGLAKIHYDPKNPRNYRVIATRRMKLIPRSHEEILFHYNRLRRGLLHYYSFRDNRRGLRNLLYTLKLSCALTLKSKYKLSTLRARFKRFGSSLRYVPKRKTSSAKKRLLFSPETFANFPEKEKFTYRGDLRLHSLFQTKYKLVKSN